MLNLKVFGGLQCNQFVDHLSLPLICCHCPSLIHNWVWKCTLATFLCFAIFRYLHTFGYSISHPPSLPLSIQRSAFESVITFIITFFISTKPSFSLPLVYQKTIVPQLLKEEGDDAHARPVISVWGFAPLS